MQASPRDGIGTRPPHSTNANRRHPDIHPRPPTPSRRHVHPRRIRRHWPLPRRLRRPHGSSKPTSAPGTAPGLTVVHAAGGSVNGYLTTDALLKATRSSPHSPQHRFHTGHVPRTVDLHAPAITEGSRRSTRLSAKLHWVVSRALGRGRQPISRAAAKMRSRVSVATPGRSLNTKDEALADSHAAGDVTDRGPPLRHRSPSSRA
jgi:hypothetical protein